MSGRLVLAELHQLRTIPTPAVLLAVLAVLAGGFSLFVAVLARQDGADLGSTGFARALLVSAGQLTLFPLLLGLLGATARYRHGSHVTDHLVAPRPAARVVATGTALAVVGAGLGAGAVLAVVLAAAPVVLLDGASITGLLSLAPAAGAAAAASMALLAVLGAALGSLVRNQVVAVAVGVGWVFVAEAALLGLAPGTARWLPGQAALTAGTRDGTLAAASLPPWAALGLLAGYAAAFVLAAAALARRRDVVR